MAKKKKEKKSKKAKVKWYEIGRYEREADLEDTDEWMKGWYEADVRLALDKGMNKLKKQKKADRKKRWWSLLGRGEKKPEGEIGQKAIELLGKGVGLLPIPSPAAVIPDKIKEYQANKFQLAINRVKDSYREIRKGVNFKTNLLCLSAITLGLVVGVGLTALAVGFGAPALLPVVAAVLGTVGITSAAATAATSVAAILTFAVPVGIAITGGLMSGAWMGAKRFAKSYIRSEKRKNFSDQEIERWTNSKKFNFKKNLLFEMNFYLVNREARMERQHGKDSLQAKALNRLRRVTVKGGALKDVGMLIDYFLEERKALVLERQNLENAEKVIPERLQRDLKVVDNLLRAFCRINATIGKKDEDDPEAEVINAISDEKKTEIRAVLAQEVVSEVSPREAVKPVKPATPIKPGKEEVDKPEVVPEKHKQYPAGKAPGVLPQKTASTKAAKENLPMIQTAGRLTPEKLDNFEKNMQKKLAEKSLKVVSSGDKWSASASKQARVYHIERDTTDPDLNVSPQKITMKEEKVGDAYQTKFLVEKAKFQKADKDTQHQVIEALAIQARAYADETGRDEILVYAGQDATIAAQLVAAAKIEGLKPSLADSFDKKAKAAIEKEADKMAEAHKKTQEQKPSKGQFGLGAKQHPTKDSGK